MYTAGDLADNYRHYDEDTSIAAQKTFYACVVSARIERGRCRFDRNDQGGQRACRQYVHRDFKGDYTTSRYVMNESGVEELSYGNQGCGTYCIYPGQNSTIRFQSDSELFVQNRNDDQRYRQYRFVVDKGIQCGEKTEGERGGRKRERVME